MKLRSRIALAALGTFVAIPAQASDKRDFEACDGRIHPGKQKDGMRAEVGRPTYMIVPSNRSGSAEACTRALASPRLLPTQTLRRAHLLRARAAAYLEAKEADKAVADIDLAESAAADIAKDPFYQRSMGVSLKLLRAIALAQKGEVAAASDLARKAAAERPYALAVQSVAAAIVQAERPIGSASASPWLGVKKLQPGASVMALNKEAEVGNFAGVLALQPTVKTEWPAERLNSFALTMRDEGASKLLSSIMLSLNVAYARAAGGDAEGARKDLAELRTHVEAARPQEGEGDLAKWATANFKVVDTFVDRRTRQIEARIAIAESRPADAIAAMLASPMPNDAGTIELLSALRKSMPEKDAALVPDMAPFEKELSDSRAETLTGAVSDALIAVETPRSVIDYEKSRPDVLGALIGGALSMGTSLLGGINRKDGFRETTNEDGSIKVEFIGNTPSATLVQEMTLLRAAEVIRAAGKPAFLIEGRQDYTRRMVTTQYGTEISSTPFGYKTELTIRPLDSGAEGDRALDAVTIIDALGPLYYEAKPAEAATKS